MKLCIALAFVVAVVGSHQQRSEAKKYPVKPAIPTVTIRELDAGPDDEKFVLKVLEGILSDYMDLLYNLETPYTTGKRVIPTGCTVKDVEKAFAEATDMKYKRLFAKILETYKSGDMTPQPNYYNDWDPKLKPVLVLVGPPDDMYMD